ncbi:LysR family transcriptional regulator [Paraburkholderia hospita]|uniref:LysR family transcriptional regulator n=1 Tax=Paraburkholderia hospita TaxID=169430 RepID=UPI000271A513|nr:LysR family transcriptional regulator [Paraburkholderia hospita]EUC18761.1 transcriptional regulator, LysR family [Burkholderia sp. BT03]SKC61569.1 DNA-binding transcriptional regulator, LysR family [Paraburkholderia hospita]
MIDFNIKLITVFTELHRTKSVSITADRLGLTPSSVSMSLARLRTLFHDPLFVRTGSGMEATPRAAEVVLRLQQAVQLLEAALEARPSFDPAESPREFRVATTDLGEVILIPLLMGALARLAPKVTLRVFHVSQDTPRQLQEGDIDLALGCIVNLENGFFQQNIFLESFVGVVRPKHPRIGDRPTLVEYLAEQHVVVSVPGSGHALIEKSLERKGIRRIVAVQLPSSLALPTMLVASDLVLTVPKRLGRLFSAVHGLRPFDLPFLLEAIPVKQYWHERFQYDAGLKWLRHVILQTFRSDAMAGVFAYPDESPVRLDCRTPELVKSDG